MAQDEGVGTMDVQVFVERFGGQITGIISTLDELKESMRIIQKLDKRVGELSFSVDQHDKDIGVTKEDLDRVGAKLNEVQKDMHGYVMGFTFGWKVAGVAAGLLQLIILAIFGFLINSVMELNRELGARTATPPTTTTPERR